MKWMTATSIAWLLTLTAAAEVWKLVPGTSLGPIKLGDGPAQVNTLRSVLTPKDATTTSTGAYLRYSEGVDLSIQNGQVAQIIVYNTTLNCKNGVVEISLDGNLKIGSGIGQVEAAFGRGYQMHALPVAKKEPPMNYYAYTSRGVGIVTKGGKIFSVSVWPRK